MQDKIEMSLDDIIKANKKTKGFGGGKRRSNPTAGASRGSPKKKFGGGGIQKGRSRGGITRPKYIRGDVNKSWKHDMFEGGRKAGIASAGVASRALGGSTKLVVGNLDFSVSDGDINELFAEFGPLKQASVHYDRSGRSLGTADVVFERRNDALKAMKQYNGVPLDGRPMKIEIASSEIVRPVVQRSPVKKFGGATRGRLGGGGGQRRGTTRPGMGGRGGRKPAGGAGGGRQPRQNVTQEQLDAELDAYTMQG